jgi:hypothetical protein
MTAVGAAAPYAGRLAAFPVSVLSGMSPAAQAFLLKGGFKGGSAAKAAMSQVRGTAPMAAPIDLMDSALAKIKSRGMTDYVRNQALWKQDPTVLNHQPIFDALTRAEQRALSDSGTAGTVDASTGATTPTRGFQKDPLALSKIQEMRDIVMDHLTDPYEKHNVESFDALKQRLGTVLDSVPPGSRSEAAVLDAYNSTKQSILDQTPGYAKAMREYQDMNDRVRDIKRTFSAGNDAGGGVSEGASKETMLGKLQSAMRDDVSSRFGYKRSMLDVLAQEEPDLPYAVAGQAGRTPLSRGLAGRLGELEGLMHLSEDPVKGLALLAATSPRLISESLNAAGKTGRIGSALGLNSAGIISKMKRGYQLSQTPEAQTQEPNPLGLLLEHLVP